MTPINKDCWGRRSKEYQIKENLLYTLREFYIKYDMSWVDKFVDDLYADKLTNNELFEKYNIIYRFVPSDSDQLIVKANYTSAKYYDINFNQTILKAEDEEKLKEELKIELKRIITHEDTHRQQDQKGFDMSKVPGPDKPTKEYLSHPTEIAAWGREIAQYLEPYGLKEALQFVEFQTFEDKEKDKAIKQDIKDVIQWYHSIGGSVYNKFLSEIYRYLYGED
jgi:hypothetical protein